MRRLLVCFGLALVTFAVYARVLGNEFLIYDDQVQVTENAHVKAGITIEGIRWALTTGEGANWHPVTWLSHMFDVQMFGVASGPHHLTSLLIHIANTLLLLFVLERLTGAFWRSAFVAGLFALHPLHVESVAWLAERKDVLSTLFWFLTIWAYVLWVERPTLARYALTLSLFALGLMSKPMLVTVPFVLLLLDWWPLGRLRLGARPARAQEHGPGGEIRGSRSAEPRASGPSGGSSLGDRGRPGEGHAAFAKSLAALVLEKWPFFVLAVASSVVTFFVQQSGGAVATTVKYPLDRRIGNALIAYVRYLLKTVWPSNLTVFYPYPRSLAVWQVAGSVAVLAALTFVALRYARQRPYLLMGWLWYLGTLVPVIGLVQVGLQSMADRYSYVPLIGIFIAVAWGACDLAGIGSLSVAAPDSACVGARTGGPSSASIPGRAAVPAVPLRRSGAGGDTSVRAGGSEGRTRAIGTQRFAIAALSVIGVVLLAACSAVTYRQTGTWKDTITLFNHALDVTKDNPVAHNVLANVLASRGQYDDAIGHFEAALRIVPDYETNAHLGLALAIKGRYDEAIQHYQEAVRLNPSDFLSHRHFAEVLHHEGRTAEAILQYAEAVRLKPNDAQVRTNYAAALADVGRIDEAIPEYEAAIRADPTYPEAYNNLGVALASKGRREEALARYAEAVRLKPDFADARFNLANALGAAGRLDEAIDQLSQLVRLQPGYPNARTTLDRALARRAGVSAANGTSQPRN